METDLGRKSGGTLAFPRGLMFLAAELTQLTKILGANKKTVNHMVMIDTEIFTHTLRGTETTEYKHKNIDTTRREG